MLSIEQTERQRILKAVGNLIDCILEDRSKTSEYIAGAMRVLEELEHLCKTQQKEVLPLGELKTPPF